MFIEKKGTDYELPKIDSDELKIQVIPQASLFLQSFPNPARDKCYIPFMLKEEADVTVTIYNILGQKVKTIEAGYKQAGFYTTEGAALSWDLQNDNGQRVANGIYFIKLTAGKFSATKTMVKEK